jgi:predicted DNA-binding transcriptional regulator YafY
VLPLETYRRLEGHFTHAEKVLEGVPDSKLAAWPKKVRVLSAGLPVRFPEVHTDILDVVSRALLEDRRFKCTYQRRDGEVRAYDVNPLALVYRDALGVLVCTLNKHDTVITLAPHRIQSAELVASARKPPPGFDLDEYLHAGGTGFLLEKDPVELRALVHHKAVPTIAELPVSADQRLEPYDDGRMLLCARVPSSLELRRWVLGFGDALEVLSPAPLREKLRAIHASLAARYARDPDGAAEPWTDPHALEERGYLWGS